jgi:hypothetical protein
MSATAAFTSTDACEVLRLLDMDAVVSNMRAHEASIVDAAQRSFATSALRFRGSVDVARYQSIMVGLVEASALAAFGGFAIGSADAREVERIAAFVGAQFASEGSSTFDLGAFFQSARDAIVMYLDVAHRESVAALYQWLILVAADAFSTASVKSLEESMYEDLDRGTPVVLLAPKAVAVFFIGSPTLSLVTAIAGRAMMATIANSSVTLIVSCDGLSATGMESMEAAKTAFLGAGFPTLTYILVGTSRQVKNMQAQWAAAGLKVDRFDEIQHAVVHCGSRNGYTPTTTS